MLYSNQLDGFNTGGASNFAWVPDTVVPSNATDWTITAIGQTTDSANSSYANDAAWLNYASTKPIGSIEQQFTDYVNTFNPNRVRFTAVGAIIGFGGNPYEILPFPAHPQWKYYSIIVNQGG